MQVNKLGRRYERPWLSVNELTDEDVLTVSGDGEIVDDYNDGWVNPFVGSGGAL